MTAPEDPRCDQAVTAQGYGDDCCGPQAACGKPAAWLHAESGLSLCDEHETNARKYSYNSGTWRVGDVAVSYPDGWRRIEGDRDTENPPALEVVHLER